MQNISNILDIIKQIEGIESDYALSKILFVGPSYPTSWRKRNTIPYKTLLFYCEMRGLILNTLLTGEGHLYKQRVKFGKTLISKIQQKSKLTSEEVVANKLDISRGQFDHFVKSGFIPLQIVENYCECFNVGVKWLLGSVEYSEAFESKVDAKIAESKLETKEKELAEIRLNYKKLNAGLKKLVN